MMENELPEGWEQSTVEEISERIHYGYTASSTQQNTGIQLLRITDIQENRVNWSTVPFCEISPKDAEKYLLKEGDLVFARTGATVGKSFLLQEGVPNAVFASYLIRIIINKAISKNYLNYFFNSSSYWQQITDGARGIGQPNVNAQTLSQIHLPIPPLAEQTRIVAKLDTAFGHLETLKTSLARIPELLKKFRQTVLNQAVTGNLTEGWRENNDVDTTFFIRLEDFHRNKKNPLRYRQKEGTNEDLELFAIPNSWQWTSNYKLATDGNNSICAGPFGTIFKAKDFRQIGVPIIFLRNVKPGKFVWKNPNYMDEQVWAELHQSYSVYGGELLVTKLGDPPGDAAIYPNDVGVSMVTPDVMKMSVDNRVAITEYLMYYFNSDVSRDLLSKISFGMTRLRIDLTMFKAFQIPLPTLEEQNEIVKRVQSLFAQADALEAQYQSLKAKIDKLPQALLAKAFRGELVPQDPADEPASVLLEKIKAATAAVGKKGRKTGQTALAFMEG